MESIEHRFARLARARAKGNRNEGAAISALSRLRRYGAQVSFNVRTRKGLDVRIGARGHKIVGDLKDWANHYGKTTNQIQDNILDKDGWEPENPHLERYVISRNWIDIRGKARELLEDAKITQITIAELIQYVLSILCVNAYNGNSGLLDGNGTVNCKLGVRGSVNLRQVATESFGSCKGALSCSTSDDDLRSRHGCAVNPFTGRPASHRIVADNEADAEYWVNVARVKAGVPPFDFDAARTLSVYSHH